MSNRQPLSSYKKWFNSSYLPALNKALSQGIFSKYKYDKLLELLSRNYEDKRFKRK